MGVGGGQRRVESFLKQCFRSIVRLFSVLGITGGCFGVGLLFQEFVFSGRY